MGRRHPVQREKDLADIADRYLRLHEPQAVIAAALNVAQSTISADIKVLVKRWQASALMDVDQAKAEELARINRLELEYWDAWEASQLDKESTIAEKVSGTETRTKAQKRSEGQCGNPTFLAGVQWCIERRCKIIGVDAPTREERKEVRDWDIEDQIHRELAIMAHREEGAAAAPAEGDERSMEPPPEQPAAESVS